MEFDLGIARWINRVRWNCEPGMPWPGHCPSDYSIMVSNDATNWQTVVAKSTNGILDGNEALFPAAYSRYIRLSTTKVADGTGWALSALEFWTEGY